MSSRLARFLSTGIEFLRDGGTVEAYLVEATSSPLSPSELKELETLLNQAAELLALAELPIPAPRARTANRSKYLGTAAEMREQLLLRSRGWRRLLQPATLRAMGRIALITAIVLMVGVGGLSASADSLPGSVLYPIKIAAEDTRLALASDRPARAALYTRFAAERGEELLRLTEEGHQPPEDVLQRMAGQWEGAVRESISAPSSQAHKLLKQVIETTGAQAAALRTALVDSTSTTHDILATGLSISEQALREAQAAMSLLDVSPGPSAAPTEPPTPASPPTLSPLPSATTTATETSSPTPAPTSTPQADTATATRAGVEATATPLSIVDATPTALATRRPTRGVTPSASPSVSPSPVLSATPKPTSSYTAEPSPTVSPTTPAPTETQVAIFRLTIEDTPDPVPSTHRIHYVICVVNEGRAPLTNTYLESRWSPRECVYYLPGNPQSLSWALGTVDPGTQSCVAFALNTYSICGGRTVANEASLTCEQGGANATAFTRLGPTPIPSVTPTVTPTLTVTPTSTLPLEASPSPTLTPTGTVATSAFMHAPSDFAETPIAGILCAILPSTLADPLPISKRQP